MDSERSQRILLALQSLTASNAGKASILESIRVLDAEIAESNSGLPSDLDHYLRRRSYEKALQLLTGGQPGAGTCGRGS